MREDSVLCELISTEAKRSRREARREGEREGTASSWLMRDLPEYRYMVSAARAAISETAGWGWAQLSSKMGMARVKEMCEGPSDEMARTKRRMVSSWMCHESGWRVQAATAASNTSWGGAALAAPRSPSSAACRTPSLEFPSASANSRRIVGPYVSTVSGGNHLRLAPRARAPAMRTLEDPDLSAARRGGRTSWGASEHIPKICASSPRVSVSSARSRLRTEVEDKSSRNCCIVSVWVLCVVCVCVVWVWCGVGLGDGRWELGLVGFGWVLVGLGGWVWLGFGWGWAQKI